jgi:hypothetical protein
MNEDWNILYRSWELVSNEHLYQDFWNVLLYPMRRHVADEVIHDRQDF